MTFYLHFSQTNKWTTDFKPLFVILKKNYSKEGILQEDFPKNSLRTESLKYK